MMAVAASAEAPACDAAGGEREAGCREVDGLTEPQWVGLRLEIPMNPLFLTVAFAVAVAIVLFVSWFGYTRTTRFYKEQDTTEYIRNLWARYVDPKDERDPPDEASERKIQEPADRLIAYADRALDRQINKAIGILTFNSITGATFTVAFTEIAKRPVGDYVLPLFVLAFGGLVLSSCICLWRIFLVEYEGSGGHNSFRKDFEWTVKVSFRRAAEIEWATIISLASLLAGVIGISISKFV
jgi:hypothetical protein